MSGNARRQALTRLVGWLVAGGCGAAGIVHLHAEERDGRVIEIEARRFVYSPAEIVVQQGESVTLALKALDFAHGFNLPELGIRADLIPGRVVKIRLHAERAGRFTFLCDNFCGDGHEEMNGMLIVETRKG